MLYIPIYLVFIPIVSAMLIFLFQRKNIIYLAFIAQFLISVLVIVYFIEYQNDFSQTLFVFGGWNPLVGISFVNDAISMVFLFAAILLWWMVLLYTFQYKDSHRNFLFFLLFLEGVFLALLQTNDLFNMFVFIELITILVTILVAYEKAGNSFRAAIYYLLINTAGVLSFLLAIILIYFTFGNINIQEITRVVQTSNLTDTLTIRFAFVLLLTSISVKSALFPLFTWLPRAHAVAKSGVSALLSGIVVKGGIYVLIRISLMFQGGSLQMNTFLLVMGITTALVGVIFAMSQTDIKQILAFHTVSQIGIIVIGISFLTGSGFYGGILHLVNHALFKSLLFLGAGVIVSVYNTKTISKIRGVFQTMPFLSILMIVGMLSITGAPLFNGFISKSVIKHDLDPALYWLLQLVNLGTATSFVKMSQIFFGPRKQKQVSIPFTKYLPMSILALSCIVMGLFHVQIASTVFNIDLSYYKSISVQYIVEYIIMISLGYLVYRFIISRYHNIIKAIRSFVISFETANILFLSFLSVLVVIFILIPGW